MLKGKVQGPYEYLFMRWLRSWNACLAFQGMVISLAPFFPPASKTELKEGTIR